jgi:hypothetical protein
MGLLFIVRISVKVVADNLRCPEGKLKKGNVELHV